MRQVAEILQNFLPMKRLILSLTYTRLLFYYSVRQFYKIKFSNFQLSYKLDYTFKNYCDRFNEKYFKKLFLI